MSQLREKTFKGDQLSLRGQGQKETIFHWFQEGKLGGSQEDIRKKGEGCVQDPEEEKAAEFSSLRGVKVKSIKDFQTAQGWRLKNLGHGAR